MKHHWSVLFAIPLAMTAAVPATPALAATGHASVTGCAATADGDAAPSPSAAAAPVKPGGAGNGATALWIKVGRGRWCRGWGICIIKGDEPDRALIEARLAPGRAGTVTLSFRSERAMPARELFHVDKDIAVPAAIAARLGHGKGLAIAHGAYRPSLADGGHLIRVELRPTR